MHSNVGMTGSTAPKGLAEKKPAGSEKAATEKTPLEAISHGVVLSGIPTFPSFTEHRRHILVHMSAVFRFFARSGFTEGLSG